MGRDGAENRMYCTAHKLLTTTISQQHMQQSPKTLHAVASQCLHDCCGFNRKQWNIFDSLVIGTVQVSSTL